MNWWKDLKGKVRRRELLKNHTTFKIGGLAKFFIEPKDIADLKLLLSSAKRYKIPILVIGAGSNILASDKGAGALVLRLNSPYFKRVAWGNNFLQAGSGIFLSQLTRLTQEQGLSGLEFLAGIPGTLGGALMMNAGISEKIKNQKSKIKNIGDLVENITVIDYNGNIKTLNKKDIEFGYRRSGLSRYIILSSRLKLKKSTKKKIKAEINRHLSYRKFTQDLFWPSAGCIFRNPARYSAGRLIDLCGLKGRQIGGARISSRHANFIVNMGGARANEVLRLMALIKKEVKKKFQVTLEPEIKIWQ